MRDYMIIRGKKAWTVRLYSATSADVWWQVVNPRTGKGWQKSRDLQVFRGERAVGKAMQAWMAGARGTAQEVQA